MKQTDFRFGMTFLKYVFNEVWSHFIFHSFRQNGNIWLNDTALKSIWKEGKVTSLTVPSAVENKLTLQYGGSVQTWTFTASEHLSQFFFHSHSSTKNQ